MARYHAQSRALYQPSALLIPEQPSIRSISQRLGILVGLCGISVIPVCRNFANRLHFVIFEALQSPRLNRLGLGFRFMVPRLLLSFATPQRRQISVKSLNIKTNLEFFVSASKDETRSLSLHHQSKSGPQSEGLTSEAPPVIKEQISDPSVVESKQHP